MISKEQLAEWFDCFWAIYWRKVAKKDAFRAFQKQVTSEEIFSAVMDGVRLQHRHMMKRQPEFQPHAATWLNGWRCNDVLNPSGEFRPPLSHGLYPGEKHGVNCPKRGHGPQGGYLHEDSFDGSYDVDGVNYCGRCHEVLQ